MKFALFTKGRNGTAQMAQVVTAERMTAQDFQKVYSGRLATPEEIIKYGITESIRPGFAIWRRDSGEMVAFATGNEF